MRKLVMPREVLSECFAWQGQGLAKQHDLGVSILFHSPQLRDLLTPCGMRSQLPAAPVAEFVFRHRVVIASVEDPVCFQSSP